LSWLRRFTGAAASSHAVVRRSLDAATGLALDGFSARLAAEQA
jgi:hypothetical protein